MHPNFQLNTWNQPWGHHRRYGEEVGFWKMNKYIPGSDSARTCVMYWCRLNRYRMRITWSKPWLSPPNVDVVNCHHFIHLAINVMNYPVLIRRKQILIEAFSAIIMAWPPCLSISQYQYHALAPRSAPKKNLDKLGPPIIWRIFFS